MTADFDATDTAPGSARRFVRETLTAWGLDQVIDAASLVTSELVTNALVHGHSACTLTLQLDPDGGRLRVEAADQGSGGAAMRHDDDPTAPGGRGLVIVDALSTRWGTDRSDGRSIVWCELPT